MGTFFVLLVLYMWDDLLNYLPTGISANMIGCLIAIIIVALLLYLMSGSSTLSMVVALIGALAVIAAYFIDSSVFSSLMSRVLGALSVTAVLDNFSFYFVLTGRAGFYSCLSLLLFVFLHGPDPCARSGAGIKGVAIQ